MKKRCIIVLKEGKYENLGFGRNMKSVRHKLNRSYATVLKTEIGYVTYLIAQDKKDRPGGDGLYDDDYLDD